MLENATAGKFTGIGAVLNITTPPPQAPPAPASINYPASSSTGQYNVTWPASTGATSYQLQRSANNGSTWTAVYSGANLSYPENIGNGSYRYRVSAVNTSGSSVWRTGSTNCVVSIPTQGSPPPQPATISYPSSSSTGKYNVNWAASTGATSYQLQRSNNNGSTWTDIYSGANLTYAEIIGNGSYRYRVRAVNSAGSSTWRARSTNCVVLIVQIPAAPASITYPSTSNTGRYTVSWTASAGATSYQLERSRNNGSTWSRIYSGSNLSKVEAVSNGTYLYRVRAVNSAGTSSWRVGTHSCVVTIPKPSTPTSISYPTSSSTGHYTVIWTASSPATSYQLYRSSNGGLSWSRIYSGSNLSFNEEIGSGSYRYRVRAMNYSLAGSFRTGTWDCIVTGGTAATTSVLYHEIDD